MRIASTSRPNVICLPIRAMSLWTVGWTGFAYSLLHVFSGVDVPHSIAVVGDAIFAVFVTNYVLGLWVSLSMRGGQQTVKRLRLFVLQTAMIPIFTVLEGSAVVYSLLSPERRFHVVHKPTHHVEGPSRVAVASEPSWFKP